MRVFHGFESLPSFTRPVVTVGSFDGVHLGHKALLDALVAEARATGGESVVLTFEPHPRITLGRGAGLQLLTTFEQKTELLARLGIDNIVVIPFDGAFSSLRGVEFVDTYLIGRIGARTLVAGYDHRFGHDRADCEALTDRLRVVTIDECNVGGEHVSSTVIRQLIEQGKTAEAERLLGHPLQINWK